MCVCGCVFVLVFVCKVVLRPVHDDACFALSHDSPKKRLRLIWGKLSGAGCMPGIELSGAGCMPKPLQKS